MSDFFSDQVEISPQKIFCGNKLRLQSTFLESEFFENDFFAFNNFDFSYAKKIFESCSDYIEDFTLISAGVEKNQSVKTQTVFVEFFVWNFGNLQSPEIKIGSKIIPAQNFFVQSNLEKNPEATLQTQIPPMLFKNTPRVFAFSFLAILIFALLIFFAIKKYKKNGNPLKSIFNFFRKKINAKKTLHNFKKLLKNKNFSDLEFCEHIQKIFRAYLENRFEKKFSSVTTEKLWNYFCEIFGGTFCEIQNRAFENLISIFLRCDFVRFSKKNVLQKNEREKIFLESKNTISLFESNLKEEKC